MTEKAQRELYFAMKKAKEEAQEYLKNGDHDEFKKLYSKCLWKQFNKLLTAPQYNLRYLITYPEDD